MVNSSGDVTNTSLTNSLDLKAPLASPTFTGTVSGITKSMVGLGNVDNTTDLLKPISTATQTALNLKANQSTTYTKTEADAAISNLVAAAPGALDTLNELATALGNDPNFATTVTNSIALKAPLASPTLTGTTTATNLAYTGTLTGSTGILNVGSGQVYKDASGNVGIGTSSPSQKLHVAGNIFAATGVTLGAAGGEGGEIAFQNISGTILGMIDVDGGNNWRFYNGLATPTIFYTNATERMRIDSSGNVGIGTTNPSAKLDVSGVTRSTTFSVGASGGTAAFSAGTISTDANWGMYFKANSGAAVAEFAFVNSAAVERMRIDSSGRITTPSQPAFHATSGNAPTTGAEWVFNSVTFNRGNYYNATTGRFTAPVTGVYYFYAFGLAGNADTSDIRFSLRVNSATFAGARFIITKSAASWQTIRGQAVMNLNAGDYVSPWNEQSAIAFHTDANYTGFGGYLIG